MGRVLVLVLLLGFGEPLYWQGLNSHVFLFLYYFPFCESMEFKNFQHMNLQNSNFTKKIIAKEFLFFIAVLSITLISFLSLLVYNQKIHYSIDNQKHIKNEKIKTANHLVENFNSKIDNQKKYFNSLIAGLEKRDFFSIDDNLRIEWWNRLNYLIKVDSIKYRWKNNWDKKLVDGIKKRGYKTPEELKKFIIKNTPTLQEKSDYFKGHKIYDETDIIDNEIKNLQKEKFNDSEIKWIVLKIFIIAFIVLFVLRYIKYGITWSIKTLKQN